MKIEFVSYSGEYPALCCGRLVVKVGGKEISFESGDTGADYPAFWASGGTTGSPEAKRIATLRRRFLTPLESRRKEFLESVSVPAELARRKKSAGADILEGGRWRTSETKGSRIDRKDCVFPAGAIRIDTDGKTVVVPFDMTGLSGKPVPGARYRLSCFVKADGIGILPDAKGPRGVWLEFEQCGKGHRRSSKRFYDKRLWCGTYDWMHQSFPVDISTEATRPGYEMRLSLRSRYVKGTFHLDGIRLERIK